MATTIRADSLKIINIKEKTRLAADALAGVQTITPQSVEGIAVNDFLFVGTVGGGSSEKHKVTGISAGVLTLDAVLSYTHRQNEDVTVVYADQIKFYRAADPGTGSAPADTAFSVLGSPVSLDDDASTTDLQDATGGSGYWYKYTYYNSITSAETPLADATAQRGNDYGHYCSIADVRSEAGFDNNDYITDGLIYRYRDMAEAEISAFLAKVTILPFSSTTPPIVVHLTRMLAAGYVMLKSYGPTGDTQVLHKDGQSKVDWAHAQMKDILEGKIPLLDASETNISSYFDYNYFPDATSTDQYGAPIPYFTIDRRY